MGPSWVVQQYSCCLERDFCRGHSGLCTDPALQELLWQLLLEEPELHHALQNDVFATLASCLRRQSDLPLALRGLAGAFEVLELAAVNLHLFPWRKEYSTIRTFSGVYVHSLRAVLSDTAIASSFRRMGYVRRDQHFVMACPPPATELLQAACGFFAARVECEILGEILQKLGPCPVSAEELLQARRSTRLLDDCVEKLKGLARWPTGRGPGALAPPGCDESLDLYQGELENREDVIVHMGTRLHSSPWALASWQQSPHPWSKAVAGLHPEALQGDEGTLWDCSGASEPAWEQPYSNGPAPEAASFSFISWRKELSSESDLVSPERAGHTSPSSSVELELLRAAGCLRPCPAGTAVPAAGLEGSSGDVLEVPCYKLHSCLSRGTLPSYCCATCHLLHARACEAMPACWGSHCVQELQSEMQRRMWLQRTEVDMLLNKGSGARP